MTEMSGCIPRSYVASPAPRLSALLTVALTALGTPGAELSAQEPPDSVVPLDSVVVTVTRGSDGLVSQLHWAGSCNSSWREMLNGTSEQAEC